MNINELAQLVDNAAFNATAVKQISEGQQLTLDEAYEVQKQMIDLRLNRGEKLIGLKMGFTSEAKMKQMGVNDMIWGRLTDEMIVQDGGSVNMTKYIHARAEPEICFRIAKDIKGEIALEDLDEYVDGIAPAIEIIDSRFENFKFSLEDVVADNCSSTGVVVGKWLTPSREISNLKMTLSFDKEVRAEGSSFDILGDPWKSLQAATRLAHHYGEEIKAGHIIMAGASTAAIFIEKGATISAEVEKLGSCSFKVS